MTEPNAHPHVSRERDRGGAQRHHREPRGAARAPAGARLRVRVADRHRGDRAPHPSLLPASARPVPGDAQGGRATCAAPTPSAWSRSTIPDTMTGARMGCPLVVGLGEGENFLASDVSALIAETRRVIYLEDGDVVALQRGGVRRGRPRRARGRRARCTSRSSPPTPWTSGPTATTCRRRSTSSRARSPTRSRA